jgi:hypothetical protein
LMYVKHDKKVLYFLFTPLDLVIPFLSIFFVALMLGGIWDGPCWVALLEDLCPFLPVFQFYFLVFVTVHKQQGIYSVCGTVALPATLRLLETEGCQFSKFTVFGFLCCTSLRLEDFLRFISLGPPCSVNEQSYLFEACHSSTFLDGPEKRKCMLL